MKRKIALTLYSLLLLSGALAVCSSDNLVSADAARFIATAANDSYLDPYVTTLKTFRDKFLLTNRPGRAFVSFYYRVSPPLAQVIADREGLRVMVRLLLLPPIGIAALCLKLGLLWALLIVIGIPAAVTLFLLWLRRVGHGNQTEFVPCMPRELHILIRGGRLQ